MNTKYKDIIKEILLLSGVEVNGPNPWDIVVSNEGFYKRVFTQGELGLGEAYMDGWWESEKVDEFICRVLSAGADEKVKRKFSILARLLVAGIFNLQSSRRAFIIGEKHYDLGNRLFRSMLDKRMNYSCAYWKNDESLDDAQENKLELICHKLYLKPGMRVLDIGCGWGAFGKYAAEKFGVETLGVTVSKEQVELGQKLCAGLPVRFSLMDYRDLKEKFDRIVSVGMFEHVGYKNYRTFFEVAKSCMEKDGIFLLHTIGNMASVRTTNLWTQKYIFPNGMIPSVAQIGKGIEKLFVLEDWHNFGTDYDKTLMAWYANFVANWDSVKKGYSERFFRMWKFFLLSSAGSFRALTKSQLWQVVLSERGVRGGYLAIR